MPRCCRPTTPCGLGLPDPLTAARPACTRRPLASGRGLNGSKNVRASGCGLASSPVPLRDAELPPPRADIRGWWETNKTPWALWDGHSTKLFLENFSRQCLSRWLGEASGHGDFQEYHVQFNHPLEDINECAPVGGW